MTIGFSDPRRVARLRQELTTWTLYQVTVDKFHAMFWFENGHALINSAFRFESRSADGQSDYVYDVQAEGGRKFLKVDGILRRKIDAVAALSDRELGLTFKNGDMLIIHDSAAMRSAWFYRYDPVNHNARLLWCEDDEEIE